MNNLLEIQKKLIPQVIETMQRRYLILKQISLSEPIGRRALSNMFGISERITRAETDFLKEQGLVDNLASGMILTEDGKELLDNMKDIMEEILEISSLEDELSRLLNIKSLKIAPGSFEDNHDIMKDIHRLVVDYLRKVLKDGMTISVTGGSTMRGFADSLKPSKKLDSCTVVPARGSFGFDVETQSNSVASIIAKKLGAGLELLQVPDQLEDDAKGSLIKIDGIRKAIEAIKHTDVLIFSFGRADVMSKRRGLSEDKMKLLKDRGAIAEAFGYYFNSDGEVVLRLSTIGIDLDLYRNIKNCIMIFAGEDKVDAFMAIHKINPDIVAVTDENTARTILKRIKDNQDN